MSELKPSYMTSSSYENLSPQVIARVGREIQDLVKKPPTGMRLLDTHNESIAEIHAEIEGPEDTPYAGGSFHVKLVLSQDFPSSPPRGFFLTKIYHPNVSNIGDICVNTLKKDWTAEVSLAHVFQVIRCLLIVPFPESSLNDEAGKLFMENYDDYAKRARLMTSVHAMNRKMDGGESSSSAWAGAGESEGVENEGEGVQQVSFSAGGPKRKMAPNLQDTQAEKRQKESRKKGLKRL